MGGANGQLKEFARWPQYKKNYIRAFDKMLESMTKMAKERQWTTGEDVFNWWVGIDKNQMTLDEFIGMGNGDE